MFCCGAKIVPKRSQCEHKPYPSYNLQRSLLISEDHLPVRGSVAISAPIKCSDLTRTVSKTCPIRNVHFQRRSGAVLFRSRNCFESSVPIVNRSPIRYTFCDAPFHYPEQCEHSLKSASSLEAERSEILNSGSTQHLKTFFNESFSLVASNRCYTAFCQFFF